MTSPAFRRLCSWENLVLAWRKAAPGKRGTASVARYVLRADIVQHFASVDHAILLDILRRQIPETDIMALVETIVESGRGVLDEEYR